MSATTRARIVDAAVTAAAHSSHPSLRSIAAQAHISVGGLNRHFATREALLDAAEEELLARLDAAIDADDEAPHTALQRWSSTEPAFVHVVLDHDRAHRQWPASLAERFIDIDLAPEVMSDVAATLAYLTRCRTNRRLDLSSDHVGLVIELLAEVATAPTATMQGEVNGSVEAEAHGQLERLNRWLDSRRTSLPDPSVEPPTVNAAIELFGNGQRLSARRLRERLGSGMSRMYSRHTMREVIENLDGALFDVAMSKVHSLDDLVHLASTATWFAEHAPTLFEYVVKKNNAERSPTERRFDEIIAAGRADERMRHPELSDEVHRALILGPLVRRFHSRELEPVAWADLLDHLGRLRSVLEQADRPAEATSAMRTH